MAKCAIKRIKDKKPHGRLLVLSFSMLLSLSLIIHCVDFCDVVSNTRCKYGRKCLESQLQILTIKCVNFSWIAVVEHLQLIDLENGLLPLVSRLHIDVCN